MELTEILRSVDAPAILLRTDTIHVWETYIDEVVWLARLLEYGITPEFDEEGNLIS